MLDKGKFSDSQFTFLFIGYIFGSSLLLSVAEYKCMPNTWIVILAASCLGFLIILIYSSLANRFKSLSLIEINAIVYGKFLGLLISVFYFINLILLTSLNIRYFGDFFVALIMPETPFLAFGIMIAYICAYATKKGIEVIARPAFMLVAITLIEVIFSTLLLINEFKFSNFLPILDVTVSDFFYSTNFLTFAIFGETTVFLFLYPHLSKKTDRYKCTLVPFLISIVILEIVAIRNAGVQGKSGALYTYPAFETIRLISLGKIFTRLELFIFIVIMFSSFIKISILFYSTTLCAARIFKLNSYTHLVYPLGVILVCISQVIFEYYGEQINFGMYIFPIIATPLYIVIPLLSLIIAKIRNL